MVHSGGGGGFIGEDISMSQHCLFVRNFRYSLKDVSVVSASRHSHVATKRTAGKLLFSLGLGEDGKGRKLEMVGGGGGVWRPVVDAFIVIISVNQCSNY